MINAPYDKEFVFHDGRRAKNILELAYVLQKFDPSEFNSFVNDSKNDFSNWVENVLYDKTLASRMRTTITLENTKMILSQRIMELQKEEEQLNRVETKEAPKELKMLAYEKSQDNQQKKDKIKESKFNIFKFNKSKNAEHKESGQEISHDAKHEDKHEEKHVQKQAEKHAKRSDDGSESMMWMLIYGILIGLIVIIIIYKFVFS